MHNLTTFTDDENWSGGFYQLAIEVGDPDDDRLHRTLETLWVAARIEGCYAHRDKEPEDQPELAPTIAALTEAGRLRGTVQLPDGRRIVCVCAAIREVEGVDWLVFDLPLGALGRTDRRIGGFPFGPDSGPSSLSWRRPIDDWLADIGREIFKQVDFHLALIGFEQSGEAYARDLNGVAPEERWAGYLLPHQGNLHYMPANR
ncbi:hypothetical protein [Actinokineospora xionganensis]|uniref:Uncharacterized protein n=1 Tax=Actinokineospora xionganensis TaxID=2684470 RepID=A0ABR7L0H1_9PSEU|nr:hypothetical protein [Actinokineospora xionganensis]MBC6446189.1 hypothetical protein [Actinokineospora xionganensis]